jgi:hypothetical protein
MKRISAFLLVALLSLASSSCCVFNGTCGSKPGQITTAVIDCSKQSLQDQIPNLLPAIISILASGGADWSTLLSNLESAGVEAVTCAIDQAIKILSGKIAPATRAAPKAAHPNDLPAAIVAATSRDAALRGVVRGTMYLAAKKRQVKP